MWQLFEITIINCPPHHAVPSALCSTCLPDTPVTCEQNQNQPVHYTHSRDNHFLCDDHECDGCLVAFGTHDELQRHRRLHHGAGMERWEPRRARPIALEFSVERSRRPLRAQRSASPELMDTPQRRPPPPRAPSPLGALPAAAAARPESRGGGNWRMVDDDVGMRAPDDAFPVIGVQADAAGPSTSWPLLASPTPPPQAAQVTPSKFKALRSVTVKCACGRKSRVEVVAEVRCCLQESDDVGFDVQLNVAPYRIITLVCFLLCFFSCVCCFSCVCVAPPPCMLFFPCTLVSHAHHSPCTSFPMHPPLQGQEVAPPPCDATCRTEARRRQLANAFGIGDPEAYVSSFTTTRSVEWPPALILAARTHLDTIKAVELELGVLLLEKQLEQLDVRQPLTREQRRVVHEMVEVGYGMVSSSRDLTSGGRCAGRGAC